MRQIWHAGMDREQAEREAVRDMGDPVETGISLDSVHRPQIAWKLLGIIILISIAGVLIHAGIAREKSVRTLRPVRTDMCSML